MRDCTLLILWEYTRQDLELSYTMLRLNTHDNLVGKLEDMATRFGHNAPAFRSHLAIDDDGSNFGLVRSDPFGDPLIYVLAGHLVLLKHELEIVRDYHNAAAWAYIEELPPGMRVVLYWS